MKERTTQGNGFPSAKPESEGTRGIMCTTVDEVEKSEQPVGSNEQNPEANKKFRLDTQTPSSSSSGHQ